MRNITRHTGTLEILRREKNSYYGNPRYFCRVDGWSCYTAVDSSYAYSLPNYEGKTVTVEIGMHYGKPTIRSLKGE